MLYGLVIVVVVLVGIKSYLVAIFLGGEVLYMLVITCIVQNKVPLLNQMKHAIYWLKDSNRIIVIVMVITNNINKLLHVIIFRLKYLIESSNGH